MVLLLPSNLQQAMLLMVLLIHIKGTFSPCKKSCASAQFCRVRFLHEMILSRPPLGRVQHIDSLAASSSEGESFDLPTIINFCVNVTELAKQQKIDFCTENSQTV